MRAIHSILFLGLSLCLCRHAQADDLRTSFPSGEGARFTLSSPEFSGNLDISVASSTKNSVGIEYHFSNSSSVTPLDLWQQFVIEKTAAGVKIKDGYIYAKEMTAPERLGADALKGFDGLEMNDFLFSDKQQLSRFEIGKETVEVEAGRVQATHYRQTMAGRTFDYWISDSARPIGLVKLECKGPKDSDSYKVTLSSLLKHVGRKINPAKAVPMSQKGMSLLPTLPALSNLP